MNLNVSNLFPAALLAALLAFTAGCQEKSRHERPASTQRVYERIEASGLFERGWLPYAQALDRIQTYHSSQTRHSNLDPFSYELVQKETEPGVLPVQRGEAASTEMAEILALVEQGNAVALPRDFKSETFVNLQRDESLLSHNPGLLARYTSYYAAWLSAEGRVVEAVNANLTVLRFLENCRFGTYADFNSLVWALRLLADNAIWLIYEVPRELAEQLGDAYLAATDWVTDYVLQPEFERERIDRMLEDVPETEFIEIPWYGYSQRIRRSDYLEALRDAQQRDLHFIEQFSALQTQQPRNWQLTDLPSKLSREDDQRVSDVLTQFGGMRIRFPRFFALTVSDAKMVFVESKLRLFNLQHGRFPASLLEAMTEEEATDPSTGELFHYRKFDYNRFDLQNGLNAP